MLNWSIKTKAMAVIALFAVYFPIALYLRYTYVPPSDGFPALKRPFQSYRGSTGFDVWSPAPELEEFADSTDHPMQSPFVIFENGKPLGPAHSAHAEIARLGHGRFSHWKNIGFIFSSSDGTNPETNGRLYRPVRLSPSAPIQK
jgi:hypothetical protein